MRANDASKHPPGLPKLGRDSFIGLQEFLVGYSKDPKQPQSSARPICQLPDTLGQANQPPYTLLHIGARRATHYATGEKREIVSNLPVKT